MDEQLDWTAGVVAIIGRSPKTRQQRPVGAGFVVSTEGLILTCAHVLEQTDWPLADWDTPVDVRFQVDRRFFQARVQEDCFSERIKDDYALLRLVGELPAGVAALPLGPAAGSDGHTVYFRGYPANHPGVMGGAGEVLAVETRNDGRRELQLKSEEATFGYSGGPVWDPAWQRVIGLFQSGHTKPDSAGKLGYAAFAIPAETLAAACRERLALQVAEELHPVSSDAAYLAKGQQQILERLEQRREVAAGAEPAKESDEGTGFPVPDPLVMSRFDRVKLYKAMSKWLSVKELKDLTYTMGVDYDDLGGSGKSDNAREFIQWCERHNKLRALLEALVEVNTDQDWYAHAGLR